MDPKRVLVAFSSRTGSTGVTAEAIADVLRAAGIAVDCRPKEEVADVAAYDAVILGSGVFVASRASDGGGFLEQHAAALRSRDVWLFCIGPIGGGGGRSGDAAAEDCPVVTVGHAIGARGVALFGSIGMPAGPDPVAALQPTDQREVRAWATSIAVALGADPMPVAARHHRCHGMAAAG
jgi:menaquinone-dependent protoporphyrinogen oxidase